MSQYTLCVVSLSRYENYTWLRIMIAGAELRHFIMVIRKNQFLFNFYHLARYEKSRKWPFSRTFPQHFEILATVKFSCLHILENKKSLSQNEKKRKKMKMFIFIRHWPWKFFLENLFATHHFPPTERDFLLFPWKLWKFHRLD